MTRPTCVRAVKRRIKRVQKARGGPLGPDISVRVRTALVLAKQIDDSARREKFSDSLALVYLIPELRATVAELAEMGAL